MNQQQYYLTKLAEECAEVAQIALKTQQFGPDSVMPGQPLNNFELCHMELDDLWAMVEELNEKFGFGYVPSQERIAAKKAKVRKYLGYSVHLGLVEGESDVREHPMALPATGGTLAGNEKEDSMNEPQIRTGATDDQPSPDARVGGFAEGTWVSDNDPTQPRIARVRDAYVLAGELLLDLVLYKRDGTRIGRVSPAMGGPRGFEPACPASVWGVIEEPDWTWLSQPRYHWGDRIRWIQLPGATPAADGAATDGAATAVAK